MYINPLESEMAQFHERDEPTYYNLVNGLGEVVVAHVAKSKVFTVMTEYEKKHGEKLKIVLLEKGA